MKTIRDERCSFTFECLRAGVLEIRIVGTDSGQFGTATLDEIAVNLLRERPSSSSSTRPRRRCPPSR
jgi:hypothetical protein